MTTENQSDKNFIKQQDINKKLDQLRVEVQLINQLFKTFHDLYDNDTINGSKKKNLQPRPDLQLQQYLYRQYAIDINNQSCQLLDKLAKLKR